MTCRANFSFIFENFFFFFFWERSVICQIIWEERNLIPATFSPLQFLGEMTSRCHSERERAFLSSFENFPKTNGLFFFWENAGPLPTLALVNCSRLFFSDYCFFQVLTHFSFPPLCGKVGCFYHLVFEEKERLFSRKYSGQA